jgi:acyl-coenzyme A thioesterase PaaI-like protein
MPTARQSKPALRRVGESLRRIIGARAFFILNTYVPYVGAGVRIRHIAPDATRFDVEMRLRPWNKNYFGTHFGGSLYAMCDPFFALILTENLGPEYVVWDKEAAIRFKRPGRGTVRARFEITPDRLEEVRRLVNEQGKAHVTFTAQVLAEDGEIVAEVDKVESIRKKGW